MKRDPNEQSDWATVHSTHTSPAPAMPGVEERVKTHHTLGSYLLGESESPESWSGRPERPANLEAEANWTTFGMGHFTRPTGSPEETREQWEHTGDLNFQGLLFRRPSQTPAAVEWVKSTRAHKGRVGTALGILQNEADRAGAGALSEGLSADLSEHSAPMVAKLTGREYEVTNEMDFSDVDDRLSFPVPRAGEGGSFRESDGTAAAETRMLSRGEANMGLARFRAHLADSPEGRARASRRQRITRMKNPPPVQGELF